MRIARRTCRLVAAAAGVLLPLATVTPALAEGPSFAVRAGRVMPVSPDLPAIIENGIIVVRDGRIEAVGADIEIPFDLELIEMPDATITPGFVAASSSVAGRHRGDESFGAGYRAADTFDPWDDNPEQLGSGVTTVHLNPGWHRLVTGQGAIARMGGTASGRVMNAAADLTITLGPAVLDPAPKVTLTIPPSPDNAILPAMPQRPGSRMTQFLGLKEAIEQAQARTDETYSVHTAALLEAWDSGRPLRVQAQAAADLAAALGFFAQTGRAGYLVGGTEATEVAGRIAESGLPLVYTMDVALRSPGRDIGGNPTRIDRSIEDLAHFEDVQHLAIAMADGAPLADLRLAAAMALRSGLSHDRILAAITRIPAEILGIGDEVGSLAPGRRADMLVLNGDPLATATTVQRVYIDGRLAHHAHRDSASQGGGGALVVRAETVWLGPGDWLTNGEVLIEDGVITEVGRRVSRPAMARVVDAGPGSFVTPGLIDAHGHLGLDGDRSPAAPNLSLSRLIGVPDRPELRTAAAGVTSVMLAPYGFNAAGSRVAAIKTDGPSRSARVVSDIAAVAFSVSDSEDIRTLPNRLRARIKQGQQYVEKWTKYETELSEWQEKAAKGEIDESAAPKAEQTTEEGAKADPITGTWQATLSGGPLPEDQSGTVVLRLEGNSFEGRVTEPELPMNVRITGTLDGSTVSGEIELDTGGMGTPTWEGVIVEPDLIRGTAGIAGMMEVDFVMRRSSAAAVEFKVTRTRRTTGRGGRPLPPEIDQSLEPMRALLEKRAPALVEVRTRRGIDAVLDVFRDEFDLPLVLLDANEARMHTDRLKDGSVGVVLPTSVLRQEDGSWYHQGRDLIRHGVSVAFQSDAEDGARTLRDVGLFSVSRGMSAERALAAMTVDVAHMYGLHDRIGSIAPGRDGDLVIFSGYPFDAGTRVERVFINGEEVRP